MRNFIVLLLFFVGLSAKVSAQTSLVEWQDALNKAQHDTTRLKCYTKIISFYIEKNLDSAYHCIQAAESISNQLSNHHLTIVHWFRIHIYYKVRQDLPNAKVYLDKAKQLAIKLKDNDWVKEIALQEIGLTCHDNRSQAIKEYLTLASTLKPTLEGDKKILKTIYDRLAVSYYYMNDYKKALEYNDKMFANCMIKKDTLHYYNTRLLVMAADTALLSQAENVLQQGLKYAKEMNSKRTELVMKTNIGDAYIRAKQFEKALIYTQQALELAEKESFTSDKMVCTQNLGQIYHGLKQYNKALEYFQQVIPYFRKTDTEQLPQTLENASLTYSALKDYKNAYQTHAEASTLKEQAMGKDKQKMVAELEAQYALNEKEVNLLKKDNEIKKITLFFNVSVTFALLLIGGLFLRLMYIRNKNQQEKNIILKNKNAEISRQNEILIRTNQDLEQFAFIISHDLKEPVRIISSFATLLKRRVAQAHQLNLSEYVDFIINSSKQMDNLLRDLLAYSQINLYKKTVEQVDTHVVVQNILHDLEIEILATQARIEYHNLPIILFHKSIEIVFKHLIANALKFKQENELPFITIEHKIDGNNHLFSVKDNGIGIDAQYFDRIFVPFQRLHDRNKYKGTCLGLATCKKILEQSEGTIWLASEVGKGSTFYIKIPNLSPVNHF